MKFRVIREYNDAPDNPIKIEKGEELRFIEESNPDGDWPNWIYCKGDHKEGWIPKQILEVKGSIAVVEEDYFAKEFNLEPGEILNSIRELNGWIWGYKENHSEELGWAPLNYLEKI